MSKPFKRILLTGAAGGLGRQLRELIKPWADIVRLSDLADCGPAADGEEVIQCDLADKAAVFRMMDGVEAVLMSESWCRVVGGSGQRHEVTSSRSRLVDEGFV